MRNAPLQALEREVGVRHGVGGDSQPLVHQQRGKDHSVPLGHRGPRLESSGPWPRARRCQVCARKGNGGVIRGEEERILPFFLSLRDES